MRNEDRNDMQKGLCICLFTCQNGEPKKKVNFDIFRVCM